MENRPQAAINHEDFLVHKFLLSLLEEQRNNPQFRFSTAVSFFSFCQKHLPKSHSQILQDLWVLYMTNEKRGGFFVEFGACDGRLLSNTLLLEEDYGWTGILAEPNPIWHSELSKRAARISTKCVYSQSELELPFLATVEMPELSRVHSIVPDDTHERTGNRAKHGVINVKSISLTDLLDEQNAPKVIDYLSVDTEGSEYEILKAFDFDRYCFSLITIEHAGDEDKRKKTRDLMRENGYENWSPQLTQWEDWFFGPVLLQHGIRQT